MFNYVERELNKQIKSDLILNNFLIGLGTITISIISLILIFKMGINLGEKRYLKLIAIKDLRNTFL